MKSLETISTIAINGDQVCTMQKELFDTIHKLHTQIISKREHFSGCARTNARRLTWSRACILGEESSFFFLYIQQLSVGKVWSEIYLNWLRSELSVWFSLFFIWAWMIKNVSSGLCCRVMDPELSILCVRGEITTPL